MAEDLSGCHRCDNKACVRPDHIYEGTSNDNANDRWKRTERLRLRPAKTVVAARVLPKVRDALTQLAHENDLNVSEYMATVLTDHAKKALPKLFVKTP